MSPGINDHPHPRHTGALPKSNRRTDRNRNRDNKSTVNQDCCTPGIRGIQPQTSARANNTFQRWQQSPPPVTEQHHQLSNSTIITGRSKKNNSNNSGRSYSADQSAAAYTLSEFVPYNSHSSRVHPNIYEDLIPWLKMTPPVELQTQSPPDLPAKTTNTDRMPERAQVEGRLNQIREYIKVTSTMMDSLSQSSDPRAQAQREKLSRMVDDLYDSETKLSKLLEDCSKYWTLNENGDMDNEDRRREMELRKKVDESQRKLAQLQEHQAHLVGMQLQVRERLDKARQAQQALLVDGDNENDQDDENVVEEDEGPLPSHGNVERLERETEALRDKLQQLENKKLQMDRLVQELQTVDMNDRASCSSEGSRTAPGQRDKQAELDAMKAQLKHLKALMNEATRCRGDSLDAQVGSDSEHQEDCTNDVTNDEVYRVEESTVSNFPNSFNDVEEIVVPKANGEQQLTIENIQEVTREMKEQQMLLQNARAELLRIKQLQPGLNSTNGQCNPIPLPPPAAPASPAVSESKQSNNDARRNKRRQIEEFVKKEQVQVINQNGAQEWGSRRGSTSQHSNISTPGNLWPPPANSATGGMSAPETLLGIDEQPPMENGFGNNFWGMPSMIANQPSQVAGATMGSAEYYRQLLLGSQAQQLQMMSATMQQCCQLVWSQQREIQSLKTAVIQLQNQLRQSHLRTSNNLDLQEDHHSNLVRPATQQQFSTLDGAPLPPSSSLPNLVSLPSTSPATLPVIPTIANCQQQQQQQQLNNQVPPGNRANNYWDNFRSYSRQNLLSGSSKATSEYASSSTVHASSSTHAASGVMNSAHMNNKRNRSQPEQHHHHHQHVPSSHNRQQDRESVRSARNNYVSSNDVSLQHPPPPQQQQHQQQNESANEEVAAAFCEQRHYDEQSCARIAKNISERGDLRQILMHCLKALETRQQNESPLPSSNISTGSDSSDDESEAEAHGTSNIPPVENVVIENMAPNPDYPEAASASAQACDSGALHYYCPEFSDAVSFDNAAAYPMPFVTSSNQTSQEGAEADECSNQQAFNNENTVSEPEGAAGVSSSSTTTCTLDNSGVSLDEVNMEDEPDRLEYVMLDHSQNANPWQLTGRAQQPR